MGGARLRPLDEVGAEVWRQVEGVVFDIDDTVTHEGILESEAFQAMHELARAGLTLVAVTGRPLGWTDVFARSWPVALAVGENGAGWAMRRGRSVREGYFQTADERREARVLLERIRERVGRELPEIRVSSDDPARRCDLAFDVGETVKVPAEQITRLLAVIEEEGARSSVSSVHAHAVPGSWDKAAGTVRALAQALELDLDAGADRWLFIGDSGNDASAFAFFPVTVGVANVREHLGRLPVPPAYITEAQRGRGFAEMAAHLLRNR